MHKVKSVQLLAFKAVPQFSTLSANLHGITAVFIHFFILFFLKTLSHATLIFFAFALKHKLKYGALFWQLAL